LKSYEEKTKRSKALFDRAKNVFPGGVSYAIRDLPPHPFYVERAKGCRLTDVDGNVYTDYWMGHGALILGHAPDRVVEAVSEQIGRGTHYGFSHELEIGLAERIVEMMPSAEMVRYTNSGTEANMYATRLARAYTGRMKIAKIEGGWHGGYDCLQKAIHPPFTEPESAGLDPKALEDTVVIPFNDLEAARRAVQSQDLACIIVEPMMGAAGFLAPEPGYLNGLRELCDVSGTLLIFDEVITGFRLAPGGGQEYYGVNPDITVIGKVMGGGFPIGAFCGREEIFELIDHKRHPELRERAFHGGTFTGNPVSMVAGITTLDALREGGVYEHINALGEKVRGQLDDIFGGGRVEAAITGVGSTFAIHFQKDKPRNAREMARNDPVPARAYFSHMLSRNIAYLSPTLPHMFIGEPHTEEDLEEYLAATEDFVKGYGA
jgi:glutamate-1-semialdehyde 2,1-aminomutase